MQTLNELMHAALDQAEKDASDALKRGDFEAHWDAARAYHATADLIMRTYGYDPRPQDEDLPPC